MKRLLFLAAISIVALAGNSQTISGVISDEKGKPKKGVQLQLQSSKKKMKSHNDGTFTLSEMNGIDSLIVRGNMRREAMFAVGDTSFVKIVIAKDYVLVNDYPVFYMPKKGNKRSDIITTADIKESGATRFIDILYGRISGLQIMGDGPKDTQIFIRGVNSFHERTEPLYILDGIETTFEALYYIDVEGIESIEVNKTGTGYGVRGANGVIIVKTKR